MNTGEAAEYLGRSSDYVCYLCRKGKLQGAERAGKTFWLIPKQSVIDFKNTPKPRGFAALYARMNNEQAERMAELNRAIREANGTASAEFQPQEELEQPQNQSSETEYISVKEAAEIIQRSTRAVKSYCRWGRLKGAYQQDNEWYIPKSAVLELKERLDKHISPVELREKPKVSKTVLPAVESENVPQGYVSVETAAKVRGQTQQYVIRSCKNGRIRGARKDNGIWLIPECYIK